MELRDSTLFWLFALLCVLLVGGWLGQSYFEARAYNRVTGKNVSMFDAMFIELRVQESAKDDD